MALNYTAPSFSGQTPNALELTAAFATIESVLQNALSLQGTTPNQMEVDLDMNGHDLLNVGQTGARVLTTADLESLTGLSDAALQSLNTDIIALNVRVTDVENVQVTHANLLSQLISDLDDLELVVAGLAGGTGGVTDHGALTGLGDDDHPHYLTEARGNSLYYTKAEVDTAVAGATGGGLTEAQADLLYYPRAELIAVLNGYSPVTHNHNTLYAPLVHDHDTRPAAWTATNDKTEIEWDSGNAKYTLRARDGAVDLVKNPADTDAINNWVLPFGLYAHDPLAAHLFGEGTPVMIFGSGTIYRVLGTATVAEKQADPSTSAGYGLTNS